MSFAPCGCPGPDCLYPGSDICMADRLARPPEFSALSDAKVEFLYADGRLWHLEDGEWIEQT